MERPILFSTKMIQAIFAGNKTMTRRAFKYQPSGDCEDLMVDHYNPIRYDKDGFSFPGEEVFGAFSDDGTFGIKCPYGKPGDRLWVRETWTWEGDTSWRDACKMGSFWYKADHEFDKQFGPSKWKSSIHMPRIASRLILDIVEIKAERLNAISTEDAKKEGVGPGVPIMQFAELWESINGVGSWNLNLWVWVITFRLWK